ncbi:hypothetical protein ANANG_G00184610 [Anguilla anguilla]|uniref:Spondin-like TSP1 domain-containing protein n=1 Tax=Anguilla anguilla TaxID=7936 RepID=A0A9D3RU15_ANGAN|nr:hypothetical protein ANANG_G00184610 [Anguilla anguilla]
MAAPGGVFALRENGGAVFWTGGLMPNYLCAEGPETPTGTLWRRSSAVHRVPEQNGIALGQVHGHGVRPGGQPEPDGVVQARGGLAHAPHQLPPAADRPGNQRDCFHVCDQHRDLYDWRLGQWGAACPCPSAAAGPGRGRGGAGPLRGGACAWGAEGIQTREVGCVRTADGTAAEEDAICEYFEPKPRLEQACLVPCPGAAWCPPSPLVPLPRPLRRGGLQSRARSVLAPPLFGGARLPRPGGVPACEPLGVWGGGGGGFGLRPAKAAGVRTRSGAASGTRGATGTPKPASSLRRGEPDPVGPAGGPPDPQNLRHATPAQLSLCSQDPLPEVFRSCVVPRDCEVSEWGAWSPCSKTCYDPNGPQGERSRTRRALRFPVGGGAECPALEEVEPCTPQGEGYTWKTSEWTECRVDLLLSQQDRRRGNQTSLCGGGVQSREVYCAQGNSDPASYLNTARDKEAWRPVDSRLCLGPVPNATQLCHMECPVQCALSAWNAWGPCTLENCQEPAAGKKGFKLRKRAIVNAPTGGAGSCPHLVEAVPCDEPSCYAWLVAALEACLLDNGRPCGPGTQVPRAQCVDSDGAPAETQLCRDAILPIPVACEVPCPRDCALSPWSSWSRAPTPAPARPPRGARPEPAPSWPTEPATVSARPPGITANAHGHQGRVTGKELG